MPIRVLIVDDHLLFGQALTDFGGDEYREGLSVLLRSYEQDEQLTELGRKVKRSELRGALMARLLSEVGFRQVPVNDAVIERQQGEKGFSR